MNRLTGKRKDGSIYQPDRTSTTAAFAKLARYEDTGLEPEEILARLENASPAEEKTSYWVTYKDENGRDRFKCAACDMVVARNSKKTRYCGECGARMYEPETEE